jgi:hypothetical protein
MVTRAEVEANKKRRLEEEERLRKKKQAEESIARTDPSRPNTFIEEFQGRVPRPRTIPTAPTQGELSPAEAFKQKNAADIAVAEANKNREAVGTTEVFKNQDTGKLSGVRLEEGRTLLGLSPEEVRQQAANDLLNTTAPAGTVEGGAAARGIEQAAQSAALAQQVGQIDPSTGLAPTGLDVGEALTTGFVNAVPRALAVAGGAAVTGAAIGAGAGVATGGVLSAPLAIAGAAIGFAGSIASSIISNFKSQRRDTTTAQQRVLDEGKQTLKDWSTMAKADPSNREFYLGQFNLQLQQIQDAHNQMLIDTNADVAKFETALPNLAEFNAFYSVGGERDALVNEMIISMQTPVTTEYEMAALTARRRQ